MFYPGREKGCHRGSGLILVPYSKRGSKLSLVPQTMNTDVFFISSSECKSALDCEAKKSGNVALYQPSILVSVNYVKEKTRREFCSCAP